MFIGSLTVGMLGGILAGCMALLLGQTLLMALVLYALTGIAGTMLVALANLMPRPGEHRPDFTSTAHFVAE